MASKSGLGTSRTTGDYLMDNGFAIVGSADSVAERLEFLGSVFDLRGRSALVTGAGSGLGAAMAAALARAGAGVVLADVDVAAAKAKCAELRAGGLTVEPTALDVGAREQIEAGLDLAERQGTTLALTLTAHSDAVGIEVTDGSLKAPRVTPARPDDEGGRGLLLVRHLAKEWGVRWDRGVPGRPPKTVWAVISR